MNDEKINDNLIVQLTFEFSLMIIEYCKELQSNKDFIISNQLLRSGTSIGANVWEAQNAESKKDFIHKFKIAAKEIDETHYWLLLCKKSEGFPDTRELLNKLTTINKIVNKIITSSKKNILV